MYRCFTEEPDFNMDVQKYCKLGSPHALAVCKSHPGLCSHSAGHRTILPAPCTDNSHIGIMTILYNNIGKDLSRVSMPVALNEPLSLLQRLSEELEYSDLLDIANQIDDPYERMVRFPPPFCFLRNGALLSEFLIEKNFSCRFTWQRFQSQDTPGRPGGIATSPSTRFWEKLTRATERTEASTMSASR